MVTGTLCFRVIVLLEQFIAAVCSIKVYSQWLLALLFVALSYCRILRLSIYSIKQILLQIRLSPFMRSVALFATYLTWHNCDRCCVKIWVRILYQLSHQKWTNLLIRHWWKIYIKSALENLQPSKWVYMCMSSTRMHPCCGLNCWVLPPDLLNFRMMARVCFLRGNLGNY